MNVFRRHRFLLLSIVILLVSLAVYSNTLTHGFVYDDGFFSNVHEYRFLRSIPLAFLSSYNADAPQSGLYRPFPTVTFIITYVLFGESTYAFHLGNILLHGILCVLLFYWLYRTCHVDQGLSLGIALLFAVLPIHTEVVANIKSRDELLYGLFFLLMWIAFEKGKQKKIWYVVSSVSFLLALLSKEMAIVCPFIIGIWTVVSTQQRQLKSIVTSLVWFVPSVVVYGLLRLSAGLPGFTSQFEFAYGHNPLIYLSFFSRLLSGYKILAIYLEKILLPFSLSASYHVQHFMPVRSLELSWQWIVGCVVFVLMLIVILRYKKTNKVVVLGVVFFLITYIPVSQVFFPAGDVIAERWMYIPSLGVLLVVFYPAYVFFRKIKYLFVIFISISICLYSFKTVTRNSVWASDLTLFTSMTIDAPKSYRGHYLLAKQYMYDPNLLPKAKQLLATAANIEKTPEIYNAAAFIALLEQNIPEAKKNLEMSYTLDTRLVATDRLWTQVLYQEKNYEKAFLYSKNIIDAKLYRTDDMFFHATLLAKLQRYDQAQEWLNKVVETDKKNWQPHFLQAVILYHTGRKKEALDIPWNTKISDKERLLQIDQFHK